MKLRPTMARTFSLWRVRSDLLHRCRRPSALSSILPLLMTPFIVQSPPRRDQVRQADRSDVDRARDDAVIDLRGPTERGPFDLDVTEALKLGVLLDQLLVFHDDELHVGQAVLLADLQRAHLGARGCGSGTQQGDGERPFQKNHTPVSTCSRYAIGVICLGSNASQALSPTSKTSSGGAVTRRRAAPSAR